MVCHLEVCCASNLGGYRYNITVITPLMEGHVAKQKPADGRQSPGLTLLCVHRRDLLAFGRVTMPSFQSEHLGDALSFLSSVSPQPLLVGLGRVARYSFLCRRDRKGCYVGVKK